VIPAGPPAGPAGAGPGAGGAVDVFLAETVFADLVFSGPADWPGPGAEVYATGFGGAPGGGANIAVALTRLGLRTGLAALFGEDIFGGFLWHILADQEGVDLSWSRRVPGWPTPLTVSLAHGGDRSMLTYAEPPPPGAAVPAGPPPAAAGCFVHLGGPLPGWVAGLRAAGTLVFGDVSWDETGAWPASVLDRLGEVDVFLANADEATAYTRTGSPAAALAALAPRAPVCVVKNGAHGAAATDRATGEHASAPAIEVELTDPTGAGGVFDAAFIYATLAGWPLAQRLRFGCLAAGLSVRHHTGSLGAPGWDDIAAWCAGPDGRVRPGYEFIAARVPPAPPRPAPRASPVLDPPPA
jgi:sugar/nucleoside kinase (ribokinase family)